MLKEKQISSFGKSFLPKEKFLLFKIRIYTDLHGTDLFKFDIADFNHRLRRLHKFCTLQFVLSVLICVNLCL
uniref:Uncharacterized protein n=1 Tax=Candidatus Methanophagaceae archaeon ANME-1 ERB6 TaxID=2759912 RepID=A0A7G9YXN5_9EURY|nr:hypothetical protein HGGDFBBL_00001 [Methanosarcinales archaeon ANME-1 ERB6]